VHELIAGSEEQFRPLLDDQSILCRPIPLSME
jgi:hypothetical protein